MTYTVNKCNPFKGVTGKIKLDGFGYDVLYEKDFEKNFIERNKIEIIETTVYFIFYKVSKRERTKKELNKMLSDYRETIEDYYNKY